jgi:ubiquinol-cytochrome c reductase cytochrome c subunit
MRAVLIAMLILTAQTAYAADAAKGKALFMAVGCYECHGTMGQGAAPTGPRLAPNTPSLETFLKELRTPRNIMPPYAANLLPDESVADIRAYLAGIAG